MATIGGELYAEPVHVFFDSLRSYDAQTACSVLADDADFESPWNDGVLTGKDGIQALLDAVLTDPVTRPSFTIQDIRGDGHLVHLDVSMSNRFGRAPVMLRISCLHLHNLIHHVVIKGRDGPLVLPRPVIPVPEPQEEGPPQPSDAATDTPAADADTSAEPESVQPQSVDASED